MGIETLLFIFALILVAAIWGGVRKRRAGRDHTDAPPPPMSQR